MAHVHSHFLSAFQVLSERNKSGSREIARGTTFSNSWMLFQGRPYLISVFAFSHHLLSCGSCCRMKSETKRYQSKTTLPILSRINM